MVIRNCAWVNVQSREVLPNCDIAIAGGRFAFCGKDASHCIGEDTEIVDAYGRFAVPGLCDGHMHIESGMLTPARFTEAVIPHGTTTMFVDPHEIANVLGLQGVRLMHDEAFIQPVNIFMQIPSCVPSAPGLETAGGEITLEDVEEAVSWPGIIGLGEMMNFPGVIAGDSKLLAEMAAVQAAGKTVGGHYASPDLGPAFHAYLAGGAADDHEGTREIDAIARVRRGMRAMLRLGSAWYDVESQISAITRKGLDPRNFILCTDDCHSETLVNDGHMNRAVRHAVKCGCDPLVALQLATINTATHFGLEREIGSIAPGRRADLVLASDLAELPVELVIGRGRKLAENGKLLAAIPHLDWPDYSRRTVHLDKSFSQQDFAIAAPDGTNRVFAKVIGVVENQAPTKALDFEFPVADGVVSCAPERDICQVALIERHGRTGAAIHAFVHGFGYNGRMALASTVGHDCHNIIAVGTDRAQLALAVNRLGDVNGGVTLWRDGEELALVRLPIAGLMSDQPAAAVASDVARLNSAMRACGCEMNNAFMQHSLLALAVIPELRISDMGLVDVGRFQITPLFEGS